MGFCAEFFLFLQIKIVPRASNLLEKLLERDKDWRTDSDFLFRHMVGPRNTKSTKGKVWQYSDYEATM